MEKADLQVVKRRKKKKLAGIVGFVSSCVIASLSILAFLGKEVGTFTVSLVNHDVHLALAPKANSSDNDTTYLRVGEVPSFSGQFTYNWFKNDYDLSLIDNENTAPTIGAVYNNEGEITGMHFFKYTYYVKNTGDQHARFTFRLDITDVNEPTNAAYSLVEYIRVAVIENGGDPDVYAKPSLKGNWHYDQYGDVSYNEPIAGKEGTPEFVGWTKKFESDSVVTSFDREIQVGQEIRYTVLFWLDGDDDEGDKIPLGTSINFGIAMTGYEG